MRITEIANKLKSLGYYNNWQNITNNINELKEGQFIRYYKVEKDYIYLGMYKVGRYNKYNMDTLETSYHNYLKRVNNIIFKENNILIKGKYLTFNKLRMLEYQFQDIYEIAKSIYNIDESIRLEGPNRWNIVSLKEVQNITLDEFLEPYNLPKFLINKIKEFELDIITTKLICLHKNRFLGKPLQEYGINDFRDIDLSRERIGKFIYRKKYDEFTKDTTSKFIWTTLGASVKKVGKTYSNLSNYIYYYHKNEKQLISLLESEDEENWILAESIFKTKHPELWE